MAIAPTVSASFLKLLKLLKILIPASYYPVVRGAARVFPTKNPLIATFYLHLFRKRPII